MDPSLLPPSAFSPADRGHYLKNTAIAFIVVETCFVALRYVSRYLIRSRSGADDWLMPLAWLFNMALCGCSLAMVIAGGVGRHIGWLAKNNPDATTTFLILQAPFTIMYALAVCFPKLVILGLYLRIFAERRDRIACYILIALISAACLAVIIVTCIQCTPLDFLWNPTAHPDGHCIDLNAFWSWGSLPNIVTDVFMLVLPLPCIWKLQLSRKDKIGLVLTFATGSIGLITSIVRFTTFFNTDGQADSTWTAIQLGSISIAESGVYLMAACLPTYRSLFMSVRRRAGLSTGWSRGTGKDTGGTSRSGDGSINLISVQSKHSKGMSNGSFSGFERIDNDERKLVHPSATAHHFDEASDRETSSVNSAYYNHGKAIHVQRGYKVTTSQLS